MKRWLLLVILMPVSLHALFTYDRMIARAQKGDFQSARQGLTQLMVEQPDRPDLLYDTAVAAYKEKDFAKAFHYFQKVSNAECANPLLPEEAAFNAGNAAVQQNKLEDALHYYQKTLEMNPDNEKAKHNRDIVKKMLEQQKQQKKQQKKDQNKNQDDKKDQEKSENSDDNKEKQEESSDKNQQDQSSKDQSSPESSGQQPRENQSSDDDPQHQEKQQESSHKSEHDKQQESARSDQLDKQREQKNKTIAQSTDGQSEQEKKLPAQTLQQKKEQKLLAQLDPAMCRFLESQEKKDAQVNKQLMRAMVGTKGGVSHEDHNW
jgi:Ca-activated chloride channel family protein